MRLVQVSSKGHEFATRNVDFASLESVNRPLSGPWERYGQSKLGNILFANKLRKRLAADTNIHSLSVYPGGVDTGLFKGTEQSYPLLKPIIVSDASLCLMPSRLIDPNFFPLSAARWRQNVHDDTCRRHVDAIVRGDLARDRVEGSQVSSLSLAKNRTVC